MLSLAKLAGSDQRYFLEQAQGRVDHAGSVASGAEDYYLSGPEAAGEWAGSASALLGLRGNVSEGALRGVLSKHDPRTGQLLEGSVRRARVPGFDLMFSVPKSASILFGIGGPAIQKAVLDAQAVAVGEALVYLERHACRSRRGAGGCEVVPGDGFVGASFRHRTSRAGDPQVHTHVLVANATRIHDGTWGSLDGRAIYAEARTAGFIHEAVFRRELTRRLGVSWTRARNGIAEIEGVPRAAVEAFSRRKAEIDARVEAWGRDTAAARQSAAVQTRAGKDYDVMPEQLAPEWRARAAALGLDDARVRRIVGREVPPDPRRSHEGIGDELRSSAGLTAERSSFDRRDVVRAFCEATRAGTTLGEIDAFVASFLASAGVVALTEPGGRLRREDLIRRRDGRLVSAVAESPHYSTAELLAVEQRVVEAAQRSATAHAGVAEAADVESALAARPSIGRDQREMVTRLCREGAGVQVVFGPPGTGKTFALAAARDGWRRSGFTVLGASVARRAAMELSAATGIQATSVAALLADLKQTPSEILDARTVLVVDEAGMLGTRALDELIRHTTTAGAKLVLVGDHAQLPEIEAGGAFRALVARTDAICLETNRRQIREADRRLLDHWRSGQVGEALSIAVDAGDLVLTESPEDAHGQIVGDYCTSLAQGEDAVMLAPRRADVAHLNRIARAARGDRDELTGPEIAIGGARFAAGDLVVLRLNDQRLGVQNGTRARVISVDDEAQSMTVALPDGEQTRLPSRYLHLRTRRGYPAIEHGYAMTAHLAQGMTTDRAFVLGSETIYREWGYVSWSRARKGTRFYAVESELEGEHHTAAPPSDDRFNELVRRLDRSEAQQIALDALPEGRARAARHARITYLEQALGQRPDRLLQRRRWDRAARRIERFREHHSVADTEHALGPQPTGRLERIAWRKAGGDIERYRMRAGVGRERDSNVRGIAL